MTYDLTEDGPSGAHIRRAYIAPFLDLVPEIDGTVFVAPTSPSVSMISSFHCQPMRARAWCVANAIAAIPAMTSARTRF